MNVVDAMLALILIIVYWGIVLAKVFRVRREAGTVPHLYPGTKQEKLLFIGWQVVIAGLIAQPLVLLLMPEPWWLFGPLEIFDRELYAVLGSSLAIAGMLGTHWCYLAMGRHWAMWIDQSQPGRLIDSGPYRWVRHPIYAFQMMVLLGIWLLVSTPFVILIACLNATCVWKKVVGEEHHLLRRHGDIYRGYMNRTGRFFPRF